MTEIQNLVSSEWLTQALDNPQVIIIDCRFQLGNPDWGHQQYLVNHIPGAYYFNLDQDLSAPVEKHGGRHPLPNPQHLGAKLEAMGVTFGETLVIAYDEARFAFAARLWWLLRYFGHNRVALLDGNWQGWQEKGYPVTKAIPLPKRGKFSPQLQSEWIVDIETVKARQDSPKVILIDSRDSDRYRGEIELIDPVAGHIPGAVNSPWKQVTNEKGSFLPLEAQESLWINAQTFEEIIVYCGSGVTACVNLFSLELAGIKTAKLYPGGWSDWCSYLV